MLGYAEMMVAQDCEAPRAFVLMPQLYTDYPQACGNRSATKYEHDIGPRIVSAVSFLRQHLVKAEANNASKSPTIRLGLEGKAK